MNELFTSKMVFFSAKITFGVDFKLPNESEDVFVHISATTIFLTYRVFPTSNQMQTLRNVHYDCEAKPKDAKFESHDELKQYYREQVKIHINMFRDDNNAKHFFDVCVRVDNESEIKLSDNNVFKLWAMQEYIRDKL